MKERHLGSSGLRVSLLGLGCNNFGPRSDFEASRKVAHRALDLGITLFDTADTYGAGRSEEYLGRILGDRRKDVIVATKFAGHVGGPSETVKSTSRRYIFSAVEASLKRLGTDWIDLYQVHRPDPHTPIEETLRALDDLVRQGKVRYIGCSNFPAWRVVEAHWTARSHGLQRFISCQDEYSLLARGIERDLMPAMDACGLDLLPYFPLASGMLTGKYRRGIPVPDNARLAYTRPLAQRYLTEANLDRVETLAQFCADHGRTLLEMAIAWLAQHSHVASVITGATRPEQLDANAAALAAELSPDEMADVGRLTGSS